MRFASSRFAWFLLAAATTCLAQQPRSRPTFDSFPARKTFRGKPAKPKLVTRKQHLFRTMIRTGGQDHGRFAGHYSVAMWGCGSDCMQYAITDLMTGRVFGPFSVSGLPWSWYDDRQHRPVEDLEFHPTSRLLKVNGCPDEHNCGSYDYVIDEGIGLKLLRKEILRSNYQPEP